MDGPQGYLQGNPIVSWWKTQIDAAIKHRNLMASFDRWQLWRKYYRGQWSKDILPVNIFFMMIRTIVPRTYFRNPSISVTAAKNGLEQEALAKVVQRVDNKMMRSMKVKQQMKRIVQHAWMFGTGCGKLGFGGLFTPSPEIGETGAPANLGGSRLGAWSPEYSGGIIDDMPWFRAVHTGRYIMPAELDDIEEARWIAIEIERPLHDVKNDERLINRDSLRHGKSGKGTDPPRVSVVGKNPIEMIKLYEVKDMQTQKVFLIAPEWTNKVLFFDDDRMQTNNRPAVYPLVFNPDDEFAWGIPDSLILEPQQLEINELRTLTMKHRRLALQKLLFEKGTITQGELTKMLSEDVLAGVEVTDIEKVKTVQVADIPQSHLAWEREIMQDVREQSGMSRNDAGQALNPGSADTTATEVNAVAAASEIRMDERRDAIADMMVDMTNDMNPLLFDHWTDEQVVDIAGPSGAKIWVKFKGDMLKQGVYNIKVDPDSSVPETKEVREARAFALYERLKPNPLIHPVKLTAHLLNEVQGAAFDDMMVGLDLAAGGQTEDNPLALEDVPKVLEADQRRLNQAGGGQ